MITLGAVSIVLGFIFPGLVAMGSSLISPTPGLQVVAPNVAVSTKPTWLRPVEETPRKSTHYRMELGGVTNQELIEAVEIRPTDNGIWDTLAFRLDNNKFNPEEQRKLLDQVIAQYKGPDQIEGEMLRRARWSVWFWSTEHTKRLLHSMMEILDPNSAEDRAVLEELIAEVGRPDFPLIVQANVRTRVSLNHLHDLLSRAPKIENENSFKGLTCSINGQKLFDIGPRKNLFSSIILPAIPSERLEEHLVLELDLDQEFRIPIDGAEEKIWDLHLRMEVPIQLIAPGYSALTYNEPETLPEYYLEAFEKIRARGWAPANNPEHRVLAFNFESPTGEGDEGMLLMDITPSIENATFLGHHSNNKLITSFDEGSISSWGTDMFYLVEEDYENDMVSITLEPSNELKPRDDRFARKGILGLRIHIEDIPIRWLDQPNKGSSSKPRNIRVEIIGQDDEELFGPVPLTPATTLEAEDLLRTWLQPSLRVWQDEDNDRQRVSMRYGSEEALPQNANLRMRINKPGGGQSFYNLLLTEETTTDDDGTPEVQNLDGIEHLLGSPIDLEQIEIEFTGFPVPMRRDLRNSETPWFGGSFTVDAPITVDSSNEQSQAEAK